MSPENSAKEEIILSKYVSTVASRFFLSGKHSALT